MPELDENNNLVDNAVEHSERIFSDETVEALQEFGKVLQRIHNRLVSEGVRIEVDSHYAQRNGDK